MSFFQTVLNCYPEKSKFKLDLNQVAGMRTNLDEYNSDDWPKISEHYVGIVGKMPLYSTTAMGIPAQDGHRDVLAHEAKIVEHRLALVALCESSSSDSVNQYLQKLAYLPPYSKPKVIQ